MDEQQTMFDMKGDENMNRELLELSRWSKLFAILLLGLLGVVCLILLFGWNRLDFFMDGPFEGEEGKFVLIVIVVALIFVGIVAGSMMFFLIRAANRIRLGIRRNDQELFNNGLGDLRTYFIFLGVVSIFALFGNLLAFF